MASNITTSVRAYLQLRARVVGRQLRELGWWRLLVLGSMLLALGSDGLMRAARHPQGQWAVPLVMLSLMWSVHRRRPDFAFLRSTAPDFRYGLAAEYALFVLPVACALLAFGNLVAGALTLLLPPLVALAGPARERQPSQRRAHSVFRREAVEWVSGMRAAFGWPVCLALLAGALWQHHSALGAVRARAGWLLVVLTFYGTPEPATMLLLAARSPARFLRRRLVLALGYAALTAAPFGWLLATGSAGPGGAAGALLLLFVLMGLLILVKYAFYPNAFLIRFSQGLMVAFVLTQPGNPVYLSLLAALLVGLVWQSRSRLGRSFRF